ncbi:Bacillopeptidase F [Orchesella cincta]|uniref:Bacillopeptidase F n=1 Tax=Orchesella cincta TaxID=48709 RepID=A0A1D2MZ43_ORCCI|nr:Bacillopeptidase F [Orchesella cincta]
MLKYFAFLLVLHAALAAPGADYQSIISPKLRNRNADDRTYNVFITMEETTSQVLETITSTPYVDRATKLNSLYDALKSLANRTQGPVLSYLESRNIEHTSFWVNNQIYVKNINFTTIEDIAFRYIEYMTEINEEYVANLIAPVSVKTNVTLADELQWGVAKIQADRAWEVIGGLQKAGEGVIIATVDTGVRGSHEALKDNFVGDYGWFDPSTRDPTPTDNNGHGTHTTGTIAGQKGIGVAPAAKWAACRGCAGFFCGQSDLIACGQFFVCPTLADGTSPDCSKAPNLVSNSWGGGRGNTWFNGVIEAWHTAEIIPLFSIGNSGPSCSTANSPGDQNVIGVGSTTIDDQISYFSSVGPASDGSMKPEISAPGSEVTSAYHTADDAYASLSGTSMACPHAAGTIALLQTRQPELTYAKAKDLLQNHSDRDLTFTGRVCDGVAGTIALLQTRNKQLKYEDAKKLLQNNADRELEFSGTVCSGVGDDEFPNHVFGHGRINAFRSVQQQTLGKSR